MINFFKLEPGTLVKTTNRYMGEKSSQDMQLICKTTHDLFGIEKDSVLMFLKLLEVSGQSRPYYFSYSVEEENRFEIQFLYKQKVLYNRISKQHVNFACSFFKRLK